MTRKLFKKIKRKKEFKDDYNNNNKIKNKIIMMG